MADAVAPTTANASATDYYDGTVAVVTGAAGGIGLVLAESLLTQRAAAVTLIDKNGPALTREVSRVSRDHPGKAYGLEGGREVLGMRATEPR